MNLFDLLSNFWRVDEQKNFSGNETPHLNSHPYNIVILKTKKTNYKDYGKRKGFIHSGSDFD